VKTIADALGAARSNLAVQASAALPARRRRRPAKPEIEQIIAGQPSYGYRRVHALIRRCRHEQGGAVVNVKRVYRIMTVLDELDRELERRSHRFARYADDCSI